MIDILQSFGTLQSFYMVRDTMTGQSKGYAFCAYQDPLLTDTAVAGLHQFELLDKKLVVQRASQGKASAAVNSHSHGGVGSQSASEFVVGSYGIQANVSRYGTAAAHLLPALLKGGGASMQPPRPSTVIQVMNVWDAKAASDEDIYEDFQSECLKFGTVEEVFVAGPNSHHTNKSENTQSEKEESATLPVPPHAWGKVFVKFASKAMAATALDALAGLKYGDNILITSYFDESLFQQKSFLD